MRIVLLIVSSVPLLALGQWSSNGSDIYYNNGSIGIGITSPLDKLDIRDGGLMVYKNSIRLLDKSNGTSDGMGLKFINNGSMGIFSDGFIEFRESDADETKVFFDLNNDKVGIGTTSPSYKLDIRDGGIMAYKNAIRFLDKNNGSSDGMGIKYIHNSSLGIFSDASIEFRESDADQTKVFFNLNDGLVGIGTTTPSEKLEVDGTIRSKEVKVEATDWPDYVFSDDYRLPTLESIEEFVQSNSHLPEIPTASEIEENGLELGEMNRLLVKKIEELTLHLIEQNKESQQLKAKADSQNKKVEELTLHTIAQEKKIEELSLSQLELLKLLKDQQTLLQKLTNQKP